jgi:hypothetical protein
VGLLNGAFSAADAPIVVAEISAPGATWPLLTSSRLKRRVRLLVDTGASRSAVRGDVLRELGIAPEDEVRVATPGARVLPARRHVVRLSLPGAPPLDDWTVLDLPPGSRGVDGLLGRDVLSTGLLVVHGPAGTWTLAV